MIFLQKKKEKEFMKKLTKIDYDSLEHFWETCGNKETLILPFDSASAEFKTIKISAFKNGYLLSVKSLYEVEATKISQYSSHKESSRKTVPESEDQKDEVFETIQGFEKYHSPLCMKEILALMSSDRAVNIWFSGPSGCGKTTAARYIAATLERKLYKINGDGGTTANSFFGANTVVIDKETKENKIVFSDGIAVKAMQEGLDENGNICGSPGILFVDEAASLSPGVGIALNSILETRSPVREITLSEDNGRIVKSHPGFVIILAGNTNGLGASSSSQQQYSAQRRALDVSMIQRITATFRFGYDKKAESEIINSNILDFETASKFMEFKDCIRKAMKDGEILTPFSTTKVIDICDSFKMFCLQNDNFTALANAVTCCYLESILPDEASVADELFRVFFGSKATDLVKKDYENYDYI